METEASVTENPAMTFDEVSMERSKSFVKALQELKNLRPQLYSAADYCEKSYLHSEQKQMVLDNLKDYTVKALVNAVDLCFKWRMAIQGDKVCALRLAPWRKKALALKTHLKTTLVMYPCVIYKFHSRDFAFIK